MHSKKVRKLHLFSTKVALNAQKMQTAVICSSDLFTYNAKYFQTFLGRNGIVLGWGCKTSSLQTNCFVIDNIEMQLIRHIGLFHAITENTTKLK